MLLRKYLSLLGVGSAKIDLILHKEAFRPGDLAEGYFLITGGTIEQKIKQIDCELVLTDKRQGIDIIVERATFQNTSTIFADALNKIPFTFKLPDTVMATSEVITYRFKTKLSFHKGIESRDQDIIKIIK